MEPWCPSNPAAMGFSLCGKDCENSSGWTLLQKRRKLLVLGGLHDEHGPSGAFDLSGVDLKSEHQQT